MKIEWKYLNKRAAAVDAMKDYAAMEYVILNYKDDMDEAQARKTSVKTGPVRLTAGSRNPQGGETRLAATLDSIDLLAERYRTALEYMAWFRPAWDSLTDDERMILSEFYCTGNASKTDCVLNISEQLHVERAQVYRYRDKAITRLAALLYGT